MKRGKNPVRPKVRSALLILPVWGVMIPNLADLLKASILIYKTCEEMFQALHRFSQQVTPFNHRSRSEILEQSLYSI